MFKEKMVMSREKQFGVVSTVAAVLVFVLSIAASRRDEDSTTQAYELAALPFGVILLLLSAFVLFSWIVPLAEILDRPAMWGLGISVLGLLLVVFLFLLRSALSLDWGFFGGLSIVLGAGGVLLGETGRKQSSGMGLSHLAILTGLLAVLANVVFFALDVLVI